MVWVIHHVQVELGMITLSENIPTWPLCSCVKPNAACCCLGHNNKLKAVIQSKTCKRKKKDAEL